MASRAIRTVFVAAALIVAAPCTLSQTYPNKPIRFVVGFSAGGPTDVVARLVAQRVSERIGQPVLVENRPGGASSIAAEAVAKALPDGYTLLFSASSMTLLPHTRKHLPYDPFKDFVHITQVAYVQFALIVNPSVPAASISELVALARSRPGRLTYASGSETGHITAEMFKAATGTNIVHVPYKGTGPATTDLLSGQVNMMFSLFAGVIPNFRTGKLKVLAVTGDKRSPALPDVPTIADAGIKDFESSASWGLSAPRAAPPAAVKRLNSEVATVLQIPDVREKMLVQGVEPRSGTPEQFTALLQAESEKYRIVLQRIGFKPE